MDDHRILEILRDYYEESIFITDDKGIVVFANKVAERRLDAKIEDMLGKNVRELVRNGM